MIDYHGHLRRLVESRADDMHQDHMTHFQKLSGIVPTLPALTEELSLSKGDKKVIAAFLDKRAASSTKLTTDGQTLDIIGIGGRGCCQWEAGKITFKDLGSRSGQTVQRAVRKAAPKNWLAEDVEPDESIEEEKKSFEVGPYSEYSPAQRKAMKIKSAGGGGIRIDKKKDGKWWIYYMADRKLHEALSTPKTREHGIDYKLYDMIRKNSGIVNGDLIKMALKKIKVSGFDKDDVLDFVDRYSKAGFIGAEGYGWKVTNKGERIRKGGEDEDMGEAAYDPEEDPRRYTDLDLYKMRSLVKDVGGERKLGRGAFKSIAAIKREMTKRGLPEKMPPKSAFHRGFIQDKRLLDPRAVGGGVRHEAAGVNFVLVDISKPGGKLVSKKVFQGLPGLKKADALVTRLRAKGRDVQVIDAAWYAPADPLVAALKKEEGSESGRTDKKAAVLDEPLNESEKPAHIILKQMGGSGRLRVRDGEDGWGSLGERQVTTPALAFPDEEEPTRTGSFKISSKALKLFKKEMGYDPDRTLFKKQQATIRDIPRGKLPNVVGASDMADAQDVLARRPRKAFQRFLVRVGKVSPKAGKLIRAQPENAALLFYIYMVIVSGRDMADIILKRYFTTDQAFKPARTGAEESVQVEEKASGKGQAALIKIAKSAGRDWVKLTDIPYREVGLHFAKVLSAAQALAKKGIVDYKAVKGEGDFIRLRSVDESAGLELGRPEVVRGMQFGTRYKYAYGIFIDHVEADGEYHVSQAGRPSKKLGFAKSLEKAKEIALRKGDFSEGRSERVEVRGRGAAPPLSEDVRRYRVFAGLDPLPCRFVK